MILKNNNSMLTWKPYISIGVLAALCIPVAAHFGVREILCFLVFFYGLAGMYYGLRLNKPEAPSPWQYLLLGLALQFTGALIQANTDASGTFGAGLSPADGLLFLGHVGMVVALWQFASKQHREFPKHGFFQGWILATSLVLIGWQFLFLPTIVQYGFSLQLPQTFRMLYPTLAYIEVGMLLWIWISSEAQRSKAFIFLAVAVVFFAAGETYFHGTSHSLEVPNDMNLILWLLAYVHYGAAVLHPEMKQLGRPRLSEETSHVHHVLTLLLPLVLLLPVTLLVIYFKALHPATIGILLGFFLVIVLSWYQLSVSMQHIIHVKQLLEVQNRTDFLTGVPNRNHIEHVVGSSIYPLTKRHGYDYNALLLIDIDGFKSINNRFGFNLGDFILKAVATRLYVESTKNRHHFARVDGDEFTLLMLNVDNRQAVEAQAWQIHVLLAEPINVNGISLKVSCSIGISINLALEKASFTTMLKESERALVWAKENQSQVEVYDYHKDSVENSSWVLADFRNAIATHQLLVYYQPKLHVSSNKVMGLEALVRWHHPERRVLTPDKFLAQIEATDLIHSMFTLVLHDITKQWYVWSKEGLRLAIALNVTARDLMHYDLVNEIRHALAQNQMPASYLEIEITESGAISDTGRVKKVLADLMALGIKISMDDYGTGYSSLLYLQQLSVHYLKIDQQFIRVMLNDESSAAIVHSTMALANTLKIQVIAEGVDDVRVLQQLKYLGCYGAQGFLFSEAVAAEHVPTVISMIESKSFLVQAPVY